MSDYMTEHPYYPQYASEEYDPTTAAPRVQPRAWSLATALAADTHTP